MISARLARSFAGSVLCVTLLLSGPVLAQEQPQPRAGIQEPSPLRIVPGLDEPLVPIAATSAAEDAALDAAIAAFRAGAAPTVDFADSAKPLVAFLDAHPASPWRLAILTDLGLGYYRAGYFSKASAAWGEAWAAGRAATRPQAKALADRAFGELARMHARVGHAEALEVLFASVGKRPMSGPATELVTGAHEGLWAFRNDWQRAYLCGPMALKNLLITLKAPPATIAALDEVRSGPHGFTLAQVSRLAGEAGLEHTLVYRAPGQAVPVPSIINWKLNHYAAIVGIERGKYRIQDPTFGGADLWVSAAAIDAEASGFFLVPKAAATNQPWRVATAGEAERVFGMGFTTVNQPGATTPDDIDMNPQTCPLGMCVANAKSMLVSLSLSDMPVGYTPPLGPSAQIRLTYNQREASQPAVFGFFNVSPKWSLNLLSWIQDNPGAPGNAVVRVVGGGGFIDYSSAGYAYNASTGMFPPERQSHGVLVRIPATGPATSYELRMPDGSKQVFAHPDGAATAPRRMFLTQLVDAAGNAATLNYDSSLRLTSLTDAIGRNTVFSYALPASPLLVTRITDPFGRYAALTYDTSGRLASITDVLGLTSSFVYDAGGLINAMTTPYGTSQFVYGQNGYTRYLEVTDPLGLTERLEFAHSAPGIPFSDPANTVPAGFANGNSYLSYRNTFHWDKHVYPITHTDYTKARLTHWLHNVANQTGPIIESTKAPLERRVWMAYPNQTLAPWYEGSIDTPTATARVLDDGTTQTRTATYNALGKPLSTIDPVGRTTVYTYSADGVDLLKVEQQTSAGGALSTLAAYTYNTQHLPLTATDAAGQVTHYAYNAAGQRVSVTNAVNKTTSYSYDGFGRLLAVVNAYGATQQSFAYDTLDRVATATDSEGYALGYTYDAFDRVTQVAYPDGTTAQTTYDKLDRATAKDRLNRTTAYVHDAGRRLTGVTDPLGLTTGFGYHETGALASLTDPKGNVTHWDIDIQSRPTAKRYANQTADTYTYETTTSRLKSKTDPLAQVKTFGYATDDLVTSLGYANAVNPTANVAFAYDAFFPRLVSMLDGIGTTTFQYVQIGTFGALQVAVEDGPYSNDTIAYGYDALGRALSRSVGGVAESVGYDAIGRIAYHNSPLESYKRDYLGQTEQLIGQYPSSNLISRWSYGTNAEDRRLQTITSPVRVFGLTSTPENRITAITETVSSVPQRNWAYSYDAIDRLTQAQPSDSAAFTYGYDGADNLSAINGSGAVYDNVNQLVSLGGTSYVHDANGNLISDGVRTYQWDAEKRLVGISYSGQPGTTLRYDGLGRRLAIIESPYWVETRYLWCGDKLCQSRDGKDSMVNRYVDEGVFNAQTGQKLYYGVDQLGSVRDLIDIKTGSRVGVRDYGPYGTLSSSSSGVATDLGFAGMFYHARSGLYLTNFRAYDPRLGRWLSRDPIGEAGGVNLYGYVGGNPVAFVDPKGLWRLPDFFNFQVNFYVANIAGTFSRSGNSFLTLGGLRTYPNHVSIEASVTAGWLNICDARATPSSVDQFLNGFSGGGAAAYAGIGGGVLLSPGNGSATVVGFGAGAAYGSSSSLGGGLMGGVSSNRGQTGLGGW